jgi:hypothetical protein
MPDHATRASSAHFTTAFEVAYATRDGARKIRMFDAYEPAEEFRRRLSSFDVQTGSTTLRVVGVAEFVSPTDGVYRRFSLGPSVDDAFIGPLFVTP